MRRLPRPPSREVGVLAAVAFSVAVGFGIVAPVIPEFARSFDVGRTAAGAVVSIFAAMRLVSALGSGRLVDRLGERHVLALGIGIVGVSSALAGLAQSYLQLLLLRGAGGLGSAMFSVSAMSLVLQAAEPHRRGEAAGYLSGSFLLGGITGPALGSTVAGLGLRTPFFLYAGTLLVAGTIGYLALPGRTGVGGTAGAGEPGLPLRAAIRLPAYRAALAAHLADSWVLLGIRSTLVPLFVLDVLGAHKRWIYGGMLVVALVNASLLLPSGRYTDRRGRRPVIIAGLVGCTVSVLVLATARSLPQYVVAMALLGAGSSLLNVAPAAVVGDVVGGRSGTSIAVYQMAGDVGSVVGPLAAGLLADQVSYAAAFGLTAAVLLVAAALSAAAPETRRAGAPDAAAQAVVLGATDDLEAR